MSRDRAAPRRRAITTTTADDITFSRAADVNVVFDPSPIPADTYLNVYATAPLSNGVTRPPKSAYRYLCSRFPAATSPQDISYFYQRVFGGIPPGTKVFFKTQYQTINGFVGSPYEDKAVMS